MKNVEETVGETERYGNYGIKRNLKEVEGRSWLRLSPRRKELLAQIGIIPDIRPSEGGREKKNEKIRRNWWRNLSYIKAADVASRCERELW